MQVCRTRQSASQLCMTSADEVSAHALLTLSVLYTQPDKQLGFHMEDRHCTFVVPRRPSHSSCVRRLSRYGTWPVTPQPPRTLSAASTCHDATAAAARTGVVHAAAQMPKLCNPVPAQRRHSQHPLHQFMVPGNARASAAPHLSQCEQAFVDVASLPHRLACAAACVSQPLTASKVNQHQLADPAAARTQSLSSVSTTMKNVCCRHNMLYVVQLSFLVLRTSSTRANADLLLNDSCT